MDGYHRPWLHRIQEPMALILDFHYDSAGFQGADGVPLADGDVQGDYRAAGREFDGLRAAELALVVEFLHQPAAKTDNGFGGFPVPMDGQRRARLDGVQPPVITPFKNSSAVQTLVPIPKYE